MPSNHRYPSCNVEAPVFQNRHVSGTFVSEGLFSRTPIFRSVAMTQSRLPLISSRARVFPITCPSPTSWILLSANFHHTFFTFFSSSSFLELCRADRHPSQPEYAGAQDCYRHRRRHVRQPEFRLSSRNCFSCDTQPCGRPAKAGDYAAELSAMRELRLLVTGKPTGSL